ncbi:MAG: sulfatase-like hydrolase/transferase [Planctomycetota bacterium]
MLLLTLTLTLPAIAISAAPATNSGAPNILFIVSDDQGWGDLPSNWENTEVRLPTLDSLAAEGVRFPNYHTVPLCAPSRACMFTGQYSSENGMWRGSGGTPGEPGYKGIKRDVKMLSEFLSEAGYQTGGFGKWHMGSIAGEVPNDRGFDEYRGFLSGSHTYWAKKGRSKIVHNGEPDDTEGHTTELFTQWAEQFIRQSAANEKPFFCYLGYNAVHGPLRTKESQPASAPEAWVKKALDRGVSFLRSDYVAILEHMDHHIGRLVDLLDELGVGDNTLIVFVSDNGGCLMDESSPGGRFPGNNGPFRGSKASTYQGGLNVPFLMRWNGRLPQGVVSDGQVMHTDVFATLLDAAGISIPKMNGKNPVRGMSLLPHMLSAGKTAIPERTMIFELWGNIGLRRGDYKLWSDVGRDFTPDWNALVAELERTDLALYDLSKDAAEQNDLRTELPEVYASLKNELVDHFSNVNDEYPTVEGLVVQQAPKPARRNRAASAAPQARSQEQFFKNRDRNGDGFVTLEEFIGNPKGRNVPALTKRFKNFDSNGDGKLQLDELKR